MTEDFPIKSVRKAMAILDALSEVRRPLRVSDLAMRLEMSTSAVSRLIATLASGGLVHQDPETGRCYLGLGLTALGADALDRREIDRLTMPILDEMASRSKLYFSLSRLERGRIIVMRSRATASSHRDVSLFAVVPVHASAPGKMLATEIDEDALLALLQRQGMDPFTANTITEPNAYVTEVAATRNRGFATETEELAYNMRHVATGIRSQNGRLVATVSAGGTLEHLPNEEIEPLVHTLSRAALRVSRELGYQGAPQLALAN
ncbi:IclR family transcriptional regulator [Sphingomonas panacis]|nr:IclR family transcriptional regulator [Sphingomonas panacis]